MDFKSTHRGVSLHISISGSITAENTRLLKEHFQKIEKEKFEEAVLDLSGVPFISSSGILKLLLFYKMMMMNGRKMRINGIHENLSDLFKSIKLDQLFPIERSDSTAQSCEIDRRN